MTTTPLDIAKAEALIKRVLDLDAKGASVDAGSLRGIVVELADSAPALATLLSQAIAELKRQDAALIETQRALAWMETEARKWFKTASKLDGSQMSILADHEDAIAAARSRQAKGEG